MMPILKGCTGILHPVMPAVTAWMGDEVPVSTRNIRHVVSEHCLQILQGRLTLLLGPPGSGKSTLLKALSGKLDRGLHLKGEITYNGHR
jgi:ABC-type multidrug transport system ATPase subunit